MMKNTGLGRIGFTFKDNFYFLKDFIKIAPKNSKNPQRFFSLKNTKSPPQNF